MGRRAPLTALVAGALLVGCSAADQPGPAAPAAPSTSASPTAEGSPARGPYEAYLALGDSLAAGYQRGADPEATRAAGYAGAVARAVGADLVNLGCPGETAGSFLVGGRCPYPQGSQVEAAEEALTALPDDGAEALVTVQVGANDVQRCVAVAATPPEVDEECVTRGLAAVREHLPQVLARLRDAAPAATIVAVDYYNPFAVAALLGPQAVPLAVRSDEVVAELNAVVARAAEPVDARVARVGEAFAATAPAAATQGPTLEPVCSLTWMCGAVPDTHATDAGYALIADAVLETLPAAD